MIDDAGNLSIDFLAGFTIFMITFIYVATLIPGLFIGLQSRSIDYDAVAYRTGVVLVEDPGMPYNPSWETLSNTSDSQILRFGLAMSKDTPNILSPEKINRFFCSTEFVYPYDYQSRAVFGNYPYLFNISFQMAGSNVTQSVGDILPEDYGYSRRVVKVKEHSNATLDFSNFNGGGPLAGYTKPKIKPTMQPVRCSRFILTTRIYSIMGPTIITRHTRSTPSHLRVQAGLREERGHSSTSQA